MYADETMRRIVVAFAFGMAISTFVLFVGLRFPSTPILPYVAAPGLFLVWLAGRTISSETIAYVAIVLVNGCVYASVILIAMKLFGRHVASVAR
jgi:hypothetical protein